MGIVDENNNIIAGFYDNRNSSGGSSHTPQIRATIFSDPSIVATTWFVLDLESKKLFSAFFYSIRLLHSIGYSIRHHGGIEIKIDTCCVFDLCA